MLLISNQGNISGANPLLSNTPDYIESTLNKGYNVKIDLWYHNDKCFLGEDGPKVEIEWQWLIEHAEYLWIKCANSKTFSFLLENDKSFNFFYNKEDAITMTSKGVPWSNYDNDYTSNTIVCDTDQIEGVLGVCSDDVSKWSRQIALCFYGESGLPKKSTIKNHKENMIDVFKNYFIDRFSEEDFENLKVITKSLIFTLIPLHNNEKCIQYYNLLFSIHLV